MNQSPAQQLAGRLRRASLIGALGSLLAAGAAAAAGDLHLHNLLPTLPIAGILALLCLFHRTRYAEGLVYLLVLAQAIPLAVALSLQGSSSNTTWPLFTLLTPLAALLIPRPRTALVATLLATAALLAGEAGAMALTAQQLLSERLIAQLTALVMLGGVIATLTRSYAGRHSRSRSSAGLQAELDRQHAQLGFIRFIQHELRSYASALEGLAPIIRDQLLSGSEPGADVDRAALAQDFAQTVERLNTLVQQVYILTRQETLSSQQRRTISLVPLLRQARHDAEAYALQYQRPIAITLDLASDLHVQGDTMCLSLAFVTGLRNAVDALAELADDGQESQVERAIAILAFHREHTVVVRIEDTGPGFPWHLMERIAEHRFGWSTKVGGSGVGLAIMDQVARIHGGSLQLGNRTDRSGAWIEIALPRAGASLPPAQR